MLRRLFLSGRWLILALAILALAIWITLSWQYRLVTATVEDSMIAQAKAEVALMAEMIGHESQTRWLTDLRLPTSRRLTVIALDGTVLYDSQADPVHLDNHNNRSEIISARDTGLGVSRRHSDSVGHDLLYAAQRLPDGRVVRLAAPIAIEAGLTERLLRPMAVAGVLVITVAGLLISLHVWRDRTRVAELVAVSHAFGRGDFTRRAGLLGTDTLAHLGHELNTLGDRLHANQQDLTRSRELLETALGALDEGVACIDDLDLVLYANPAFRQLAAGGADVVGQPYYEHLPVLSVGGTTAIDHRRRHLRAALVAGRAGVRVVALVDLTEIKRLEGARRDFIAAVSHELKTPLTVIQGFTETLLDGAIDQPEHARDFVTKIAHHAERLALLVRDVLTLSRMERGSWDVKPQAADLARLTRELCDEYQPQAAAQQVGLVLDLPDSLPAHSDPELLRHLLGNLLSNAIRYNRPGGSVRVSLAEDGADHLRISVADTGIGIPAEHRERIFERFYRVDTHRSRAHGGTGLGLAIVKHLLEVLEGRIDLVSSEQGSTFTATVPRRDRRATGCL